MSLSASLSSVPSDFEETHLNEVNAENKLSSYTSRSKSDDTVKVLKSFLEYLPFDGKRLLTKFIADSKDDDTLHECAIHLCTAILFSMRARGPTPYVTPSPFLESDTDAEFEEIASMMVESSSRKDQPKLKELCLKRDSYRCVVTGIFDKSAAGKFPEEMTNGRIINTKLAHIIPFALGKYKEGSAEETYLARTWATLYLFFPDLLNIIGPDNINHPSNAISLLSLVYDEFGNFNLAFESTGNENTYRIKTYPKFPSLLFRDLPPLNGNNERLIKFENHANFDCCLPSKTLSDTHAAIARTLHASGKAEDIDNIYREREEIRCLAADGSTDVRRLLLLA